MGGSPRWVRRDTPPKRSFLSCARSMSWLRRVPRWRMRSAPAELKIGASPDQSTNLPNVVFPDRLGTGRSPLHGGERLGMVDHVQMIPHGFVTNRDARLEDHRCFGAGQHIPCDRSSI